MVHPDLLAMIAVNSEVAKHKHWVMPEPALYAALIHQTHGRVFRSDIGLPPDKPDDMSQADWDALKQRDNPRVDGVLHRLQAVKPSHGGLRAQPGQPGSSSRRPAMKIGLSLSGGGFRATVFHLGMLARLAVAGRLEEVSFLSTVSGGSLCIGLVHAANELPVAQQRGYLADVLPKARDILTTKDLQADVIWSQLAEFWTIFDTRADNVSAALRKDWGVTAKMADLPEHPRWMINATCYETGKDWRFERFRMGDYRFGYSYDAGQVPVSDAMAASAGFPILVGPLVLDTQPFKWFRYSQPSGNASAPDLEHPSQQAQRKTEPIQPQWPHVHLWDGGVYDNYGLEGLTDPLKGWRDDVEFFVISDGAGQAGLETYHTGLPALLRLVTGIMLEQIRSMRARSLIERLVNHGDPGGFLQIGNSCAYVVRQAKEQAQAGQPGSGGALPAEADQWAAGCLSEAEVKQAGAFPTVIRKLTTEEFELLYRHGFEVADYTLAAYHPSDFTHVDFGAFRAAHPTAG